MNPSTSQYTKLTTKARPKYKIPDEEFSAMTSWKLFLDYFLNTARNDPHRQPTLEIVNRMIQETRTTRQYSERYQLTPESVPSIMSVLKTMQQDIKEIKKDMSDLRGKLDDKRYTGFEEPVEIVEMPIDDIKKLILDRLDGDKPLYPSDIAMDHNLDYDAVLEAVDMLRREGHIEE